LPLLRLLLFRPAVAELPCLLHTRSSDDGAVPGHAAAAGQAGLGSLMELLAGDEVRAALDAELQSCHCHWCCCLSNGNVAGIVPAAVNACNM
jgi:hypothetical protein